MITFIVPEFAYRRRGAVTKWHLARRGYVSGTGSIMTACGKIIWDEAIDRRPVADLAASELCQTCLGPLAIAGEQIPRSISAELSFGEGLRDAVMRVLNEEDGR